MNKVFEKILERLEEAIKECKELQRNTDDAYGYMKMKKGLVCAKGIVEEVSEEYNGGWIPCSERLPDADENVLTCSEYGFITVSSCNNAGEFRSYADEYCIKYPKPKVIAWQPLPKPYQPKGE